MKLNLLNQYFDWQSRAKQLFFAALLLLLSFNVTGQMLTQADFTGVTVPQFMASGTSSRMPVIFRATLTSLTANTTYRFFCQGATNSTAGGGTVDIGSTNGGAGNPILINSAGTAFANTSGPSLVTPGTTCETFTTDGLGNYTGWFGFLNTANGRFTAGNTVFPSITIGSSAGTLLFRRALNLGITVLAFSASAGTNNGSLLQSTSSTTNAKNFAVVYDNVSGTGRPVSVGLIESIGVTTTAVPTSYSVTAGTWNIIIPNALTNGVRRIENRNASNTLLGCANDSDGTWPTGNINTTVSTNSTTTAKVIASADAPLTTCAGTTLITNTGTLAAVNTTYGTASATPTSYSVSGSGLTADILVTPPAGFEISQTSASSGYAATQTLTQSAGIVSATTIYVRLAATTLFGTYSGNIVSSSTGATSINTATVSSTVAKKALTVTGSVVTNKIYDGNIIATLTSSTLVGVVNGDLISLIDAAGFTNKNFGTAKPVITSFSITGANIGSYTISQVTGLTGNIAKKDLTIGSASVSNKVYDGATTAVLNGSLVGVVGSEDVTLVKTADFASPFVGTGIAVNSSSTITGADIANYNLLQPALLSADITPKQLTIGSATAANKVFDGNDSAVITGTLVGIVAPDNVNLVGTGTFASSAVGVNIPVTSTSTITGDISNYTLLQPTGLTANISAAALLTQTITFATISNYFVYGDPTYTLVATASSGLPVSFASSDTTVASVSGNILTLKKVGIFNITATQSGDATYDAATPVVQFSNVYQKELTVIGAVADNKIYDGNDSATISGSLSGLVGADVVSFVGSGTFDTFAVANGINVNSLSSLSGVDANNYYLTDQIGRASCRERV